MGGEQQGPVASLGQALAVPAGVGRCTGDGFVAKGNIHVKCRACRHGKAAGTVGRIHRGPGKLKPHVIAFAVGGLMAIHQQVVRHGDRRQSSKSRKVAGNAACSADDMVLVGTDSAGFLHCGRIQCIGC